MSDEGAVETERLRSYLTDRLGEQVVDTAVLAEGLNRVIRIETADDPRAYVLRQPKESRDGAGFVDLRTEHAVLDRLEDTEIQAPAPVQFYADESILGGPFSVIEYVPGEPLGWDAPLPAGHREARSRDRVGQLLTDGLAKLHRAETDRFAEVCERVPLREQLDRAAQQFETAASAAGHDPVRLRGVLDWLEETVPDRPATALTHGDYKPDNVLFSWIGDPSVAAVIDWETAKLRDPRTELGYLLFYWRETGDPSPDVESVTAGHGDSVTSEIRERERRGFWPFTGRPGSPTRRALVERWEQRTGEDYEDDRFYRAYGAFMLATVWEELYAAALERGEDATGWAAHIEYVGALAEAIRDGDLPL